MSDGAQASAARSVQGGRAWLVLFALIAGIAAGALVRELGSAFADPALQVAGLVGGIWLDALKMVVIPLIVSLLVVGIAAAADAARAGRVAGRSILWFAAIYLASAVTGVLLMPLLLGLFPLPEAATEALRAGLAAVDPASVSASVPGAGDFFRSIVPDNVVEAAAEGAILPLVVFALLFGVAVTRIDAHRRASITNFFQAVADALLVLIGWVLWLAPVGVLALGFTLGAGAGAAALGTVLHYILLVSALGLLVMLAGYGIAATAGGIPLGRFARAMIPPQAVAVSTQSSLASLPAMLASARLLGIRDEVADVSLPLAVALFRATGPAMNIGVAYYVGHWLGLEPGLGQLAAATAVAAVVSAGSPSLPGQISFVTSIAPIAMAMGVPIAPLAILVAVENLPDVMRTVGNVTLDVAVAGAVDRKARDGPKS